MNRKYISKILTLIALSLCILTGTMGLFATPFTANAAENPTFDDLKTLILQVKLLKASEYTEETYTALSDILKIADVEVKISESTEIPMEDFRIIELYDMLSTAKANLIFALNLPKRIRLNVGDPFKLAATPDGGEWELSEEFFAINEEEESDNPPLRAIKTGVTTAKYTSPDGQEATVTITIIEPSFITTTFIAYGAIVIGVIAAAIFLFFFLRSRAR